MDFVLPNCDVPPKEHAERQKIILDAGRELSESIQGYLNFTSCIGGAAIPKTFCITMASDPRWSNMPFGAVGDIETSGCLALVSKNLMSYYGYNIPFTDIVTEIVNKGYRKWKLTQKARTLSAPTVDIASIKEAFPGDDEIRKAEDLKEIFRISGEPVGIGGSTYAIDHLAVIMSGSVISPYIDTRISRFEKIISNLQNGIPVPVRVNNTIYHNDPSRVGGHYIILMGFYYGIAKVIDSSIYGGEYYLQTERLLRAMIEDSGLVAAWDFSNSVWEQ